MKTTFTSVSTPVESAMNNVFALAEGVTSEPLNTPGGALGRTFDHDMALTQG